MNKTTLIIPNNSLSNFLKGRNKILLAPYFMRNNQHILLIPTLIDPESDKYMKYNHDNLIGSEGCCVIFHDDGDIQRHR